MITVSGKSAITFGSNAAHSRALLKAACEARGWNRIVNRPPSKHGAMERAMNAVGRTLGDVTIPMTVRVLQQDLAFEAVRVRRGTTRNQVVHLFSARVDDTTVTILDHDQSLDGAAIGSAMQAAYDAALNDLSAAQVRTVVASVVRKLNGVALGAANLYYLPHASVGQWASFRDAAQLWKYHVVPFEVASDPATVEHIIASLHVEVDGEAPQIMEAVASGALEPRAAKALARRAQAIVDKIKSYEAALGQQLDWMREPLEQAQAALGVAHLLTVSA